MGLVDLLLPVRCASCGADGPLVCEPCLAALVRLRPPLCARCGAPTAWPVERCAECSGRRIAFASARSAVVYEGTARRLVAAWKERGLRRLAETFALVVVEVVPRPPAEGIAFVPGEAERTLWRGQNAAQALARALADAWALPVTPVLERQGFTRRQAGLSRTARRANVRDRFRAAGAAGGRLVLVDDVYTTGATVSAAATELRRAGAREVDVVTFARAVRPQGRMR